MGYKVIHNPSVGAVVILQNLRGYANNLRLLLQGKALTAAAKELQKEAFNTMKDRYFATKANRTYYYREYLNKPANLKLENILFSKMPPLQRVSDNAVSVKILPMKYTELIKVVPHLRWQEEGTKISTDLQPYLITSTGLTAIKKVIASSWPRASHYYKSKSGKVPNHLVGKVYYLRVVHPPLRAREFILAADYVLRFMGSKIIRNTVREYIKSYKVKL